jgi:hypothetical protein
MRYDKVCIKSFGYELPETIVTSLSLEERLAPIYDKFNLSYGRLEMITGIRERRLWDDDITPSQASIKQRRKPSASPESTRRISDACSTPRYPGISWSQLQLLWSMTPWAFLPKLPFLTSPMLAWVSSTAW